MRALPIRAAVEIRFAFIYTSGAALRGARSAPRTVRPMRHALGQDFCGRYPGAPPSEDGLKFQRKADECFELKINSGQIRSRVVGRIAR